MDTNVYKLISPLFLMYIIMSDRDLPSHPAGLAWEIATSPIVMHGRSEAQPRVETHNCQLFRNYFRYLLEILTQYGGHVDPSVYQRRMKSVYRWHCNQCQCMYTFSPTQTLFSL